MKTRQEMQKGKAWLRRETRPFAVQIGFLSFLTCLISFLAIAFAYLVRYLLNAATAKDAQALFIYAAVLIAILIVRIAIQTLKNYQTERLRSKIVCGLRVKTFSNVLRSDYAALQKYHTGDLMTRLTADVDEIAINTAGFIPSLSGLILQSVGAIVALMVNDVVFTCIYIACGVVLFLLSVILKKFVKKYHKEYLKTDGEGRAYLQEGTANVTTIKAYGAEDASVEKAGYFTDKYHEKRMKRNKLNALTNVVFSLLTNAGMIFALIWCSVSVLSGYADYGAILSIVLLLTQLRQPFNSFASLFPAYYAAVASAERLCEIVELPKETANQEDCRRLYEDMQSIDLIDASFDYDREKVFDKASVSFEKGKIICITGTSGAGKSTLFRLLLKVFSLEEGKAILTARDGEITLDESTRGLFAYVPQGNFLFSGSIYENLTFFAGEEPTNEEIKCALLAAQADFVFDLPEGLDTPLLERGAGLSEGQMQRLAIARALISNRPILLLDEATSALDEETERKVLEGIKNLQDKTCLIVTHRPAALSIADKVVNLEGGKIATVD